MIIHAYCQCKQPDPEEVDEGVWRCTLCNSEIEQKREDAPEPDEDDFSDAGDLPLGSDHQYESDRFEAHTGERDSIWR